MPERAAVAALKAGLRGELIGRDDAGYEAARKVHNGMIDRHPVLIARCTDAGDVITALRFGREQGLPISVRCGGYSAAGLGVVDGGLVIDLAPIRYARVDPAARTVRVGGGTTLGDVDHATHAYGMAVPAGIISTTGVGGLTLGGGLGHLTRKCGLSIDNLLEADMVLADGRSVTVGPESHPDLFWAIRGGGGNFGIVTSFLFRLQPISTVCAGPTLWPVEDASEVLAWYREFMAGAPDDVAGFFAFLTIPPVPLFPEALHLKKMCGVLWCYTGPPERLESALLAPVRRFKMPALEHVGPVPLPALQTLFDPLYPPGLQWYWKADFLNEIATASIPKHVEHGAAMPTMLSSMHMYPIDGAAARVGAHDTAWAYRDAKFAMVIIGVDPDPAKKDIITRWSRDYWNAIHPYSAGGAYVNFMMDEGEDRIQATYRGNYARLAAVKRQYDPENVFRVNQNIKPAAA